MRYRYDLQRVMRRVLTGEVALAFLAATVLLGVFTNAAYTLITIWSGTTANDLVKVLVLTAAAGAAPIAYVMYQIRRARGANPGTRLGGERDVTQGHRGLIVLVSNRDMARFAIRHHLHATEGNKLEQCWLICTTEMNDLCTSITEDFAKALFPSLDVTPVPIEGAFLAPVVHQAVVDVIDAATDLDQKSPLTGDDLIVDITGGTKPMTTGAVLASIQRGVAIQYVESNWQDGKRVQGSEVAKSVEVIQERTSTRIADAAQSPGP